MKLIAIVESSFSRHYEKMKKPLLAFDLDGTLIDSATDICNAVNRVLEKNQRMPLSHDVIISYIGQGARHLLIDLFKDDSAFPEKAKEITSDFIKIYAEEMFNTTSIYPGVTDFLEQYEGPIAIITNKNEAPAKAILKHLSLDRFPWIGIFGADSLKECKPSPLPLNTLMELTGYTPQDTFMIGDGIPDMVSAQKAGVSSIAIGFGYSQIENLQFYNPQAILHHFKDLSGLIEKLHTKR